MYRASCDLVAQFETRLCIVVIISGVRTGGDGPHPFVSSGECRSSVREIGGSWTERRGNPRKRTSVAFSGAVSAESAALVTSRSNRRNSSNV